MARKYDHEYKVQAVKLAKEIGGAKAAKELGIPEGTIHTCLRSSLFPGYLFLFLPPGSVSLSALSPFPEIFLYPVSCRFPARPFLPVFLSVTVSLLLAYFFIFLLHPGVSWSVGFVFFHPFFVF